MILFAQDMDIDVIDKGICAWYSSLSYECRSPLKHSALASMTVVVSLICLVGGLLVMRNVPTSRTVVVVESKHIPSDMINYVIPYVLSFISLDYGESPKVAGFAIFFAWIFLITYKSGQIILNPVLSVFGWSFYEIKYRSDGGAASYAGYALARVALEPDKTYQIGELQDIKIVNAEALGDRQ